MRLLIPATILLIGLNAPGWLRDHAAPWVSRIERGEVAEILTAKFAGIRRNEVRSVCCRAERRIERQRMMRSLRVRVAQSAAIERRELQRRIRREIQRQVRLAEAERRSQRCGHSRNCGSTNHD